MIVGFSYWFQRMAGGLLVGIASPEAAILLSSFNIRAMPLKGRRFFAVGAGVNFGAELTDSPYRARKAGDNNL